MYDLLSSPPGSACRVREHPDTGAYAEGLTTCTVNTYSDVIKLLRDGGSRRHVAATLMNSESSRSHAVFIVFISQHISTSNTMVFDDEQV